MSRFDQQAIAAFVPDLGEPVPVRLRRNAVRCSCNDDSTSEYRCQVTFATKRETPVTRSFSRWLQGRMEERGWGVTRAARELGVNHGIVSQWLSGDRNPSPKSVSKVAKAFGAEVDDVMRAAGHLPDDPYAPDPESPEEQICAMVRHVAWDPGRYGMVEAMLRQMIEFDRKQRSSDD